MYSVPVNISPELVIHFGTVRRNCVLYQFSGPDRIYNVTGPRMREWQELTGFKIRKISPLVKPEALVSYSYTEIRGIEMKLVSHTMREFIPWRFEFSSEVEYKLFEAAMRQPEKSP